MASSTFDVYLEGTSGWSVNYRNWAMSSAYEYLKQLVLCSFVRVWYVVWG